ncbi:Gfo/Idh/MocA family oxidoreductase [Candidatus Bathyarchaeota archaeon]|nr:Gfo/Idh/MocA family oxidoreductase [Candidatus Bathyarchaeota archaeon]
MNKLNVAVVGLGYWGPNYLRALSQIQNVNVKYLCDKNQGRFSDFSNERCELVSDCGVLADDPSLDAVFVITPASTHFKIAKMMLEKGKHVLVEKPLTMNSEEALKLSCLARELNRTLMVGHIYVYNPAVQYIKNMLDKGELGKLYYGVGLRMGLGPIRADANCIWDLASHELSILDYLLGKTPVYVNAQALSFLQRDGKLYDHATAQVVYDQNFCFSLSVGWYSPEKIRLVNLVGSQKMVKFDDINKSSPLTIYEKGASLELIAPQADYGAHQVKIREGNTIIPYIPQEEPLRLQINHFVDSVIHSHTPMTDGFQGTRIVAILEAMEDSIRKKGSPVDVKARNSE